ncbi:MAG: bi-domain-containing oxidoreductase [Steroidobacteraceae bacterium]
MKQVLQDLSSGETLLVETPAPQVAPGHVLVMTRASLLSAGTERMLLEFGQAGLLDKARQQPDKVRQVLAKVRTDGLFETVAAVRAKLGQPLPMGYCNAGRVIAVGAGVTEFRFGERVLTNGPHAEIVRVPRNLCARIPDGVADEQATFAVIGAIALQGLRLAAPTFGEVFVVSGLGLIGLLAVQLLRANGCRVIGIDPDARRLALAERFGAMPIRLDEGVDVVAEATRLSGGRGVDGVLIAASTPSSDPVGQAARMSRKRGRIVLLGVTGLELSRADFYEKELSFQVSCSYGPGRYDPGYEDRGNDYPLGYVRWTEQRNFEAVLQSIAAGQLDATALITNRFDIAEAPAAYATLGDDRSALGIVLTYPASPDVAPARAVVLRSEAVAVPGRVVVGAIGAGNYASRVLLPALAAAGMSLDTLVTTGSAQTLPVAKKLNFRQVATEVAAALVSDVNLVVIATRHDSHAGLAARALRAGKHVFVEKPAAVTREQLLELETAYAETRALVRPPSLTVGFNRRFAPHVRRVQQLLSARSAPKAFVYTVNAGAIPATHWTQDADAGGGRLIGEACHFIDLLRFLAAAPIVTARASAMRDHSTRTPSDTLALQFDFADGSVGSIQYFANGAREFPKERLEVFCGGGVLRVDNFRRLEAFGWPGAGTTRGWRQDKGQDAMAVALARAIAQGGQPLIPADELFDVARVTLDCAEQVSR